MRQRSLENILPSSDKPVYRYSYGFNYVPNDDNTCPQELVDFAHSRFEVFNICAEEFGKSGFWHLQGYGETTTHISKSERQMFQGKGRYTKYLNPDVKKRYWFPESREDRDVNSRYVLKDVKHYSREERVVLLNKDQDLSYLFKMIDQGHEKFWVNQETDDPTEKPRSYQEKLFYWYHDLPVDERPIDVCDLIDKLLDTHLIPWNNFPERCLISAAECVLLRCTKGEVRERIKAEKMSRVRSVYSNNY